MPRTVTEYRYRASKCREHAKGRDEEIAGPLRQLAEEYDAKANELEARSSGPPPL